MKKAELKVFCKNCGILIVKKKYDCLNRYLTRKYCGHKCAREFIKIHHLGWWAGKEINSHVVF